MEYWEILKWSGTLACDGFAISSIFQSMVSAPFSWQNICNIIPWLLQTSPFFFTQSVSFDPGKCYKLVFWAK